MGFVVDTDTHTDKYRHIYIHTTYVSALFLNIHVNFHIDLRVTLPLGKLCLLPKHDFTSRCKQYLVPQTLYRFSVLCFPSKTGSANTAVSNLSKVRAFRIILLIIFPVFSWRYATFEYSSRMRTHLIHELRISATCFTIWGMIRWSKENENCQSFPLSS